MTETQKRIKAYKEALPGLRERVVAVALLLAMSLAMMTSASFAWLTISRSPEVTGVNTTIASNGNLEIALATGDGKTPPGESKVGDSSAAKGQSVVNANQTWGNLINLSDETYGLENLTMRPAQLNTASLLSSPLYGAMYGQDGRITQLSSDFGYATWNVPTEEKPGYFGVSDVFGVRAISSTKIEAVGAAETYYKMVKAAREKNLAAANLYASLSNNTTQMQSLATMMGLYMTARMNPDDASLSNPDCEVADIQNLRDMYAAFLDAFNAEADAMAALANLTLFLKHGADNYTPYTADAIYSTTTAKLKAEGIQVTNLEQFIKDRNTIVSDLAKLNEIASSGTSLKWKDSGLNDIVNNLVNVGACTIGKDNTPISSIGASNASSYLSGTQEARITNGILYRFEERTGGYIEVKNLSISAKVKRLGITVPASVKANVQTTAPRDYNLFTNDLNYAQEQNTGNYQGGIPVAQDTYGLAVDLWVRTNAEGSFLTLEGNLLTESKMVRAMGKDINGNAVELYTVTISEENEAGESGSSTIDLYQAEGVIKDDEGNILQEGLMWHSAVTHTIYLDEDLNGQEPMPKMVEEITVLGYEGENRVWGDNEDLSVDATTQGSGSCYVYYADTPEDQARSLKLLEAFNVAFVDEKGKLLAEAVMNTEYYYAESGRVIVPLVLSPSNSINLGEDYQGNVTYAITALEKNVATRITAIVYLDGTKLTNQEVLAAADIQGKLNIQFGSSNALKPIENEELANKERRVSAAVDVAMFDYDTATGDMTTNVTVRVDGDAPSTVTAFFVRAINDSQGSRERVMTFTQNSDGDWVSSYTFTAPGNYVLRTVQLDGVDYNLAIPPKVEVTGFAIESLSCEQANGTHVNIMTAADSSSVGLTLKFAADDIAKMPKTVQGRFLRNDDGSAVNVNFTYNATTGRWTGTATFLTSGEYTLQYLLLDGQYVELDEDLWQTASVTLGMQVAIYTTSPHSFKYVPSEMTDNQKLLGMQVKIMDNAGNEMPGLSGAKLTYTMKGSGTKKMDTDLTWNGTYYVGELTTTSAGIWQFSNVVVGSNTLTNATTSPTFTILSPEPPEYDSHRTATYQYSSDNKASMNVIITNSAAATVQARIVKGDGTEYWVDGTLGNETETNTGKTANYWNFAVPKDANGYQDGHWTLTDIRMWDVFAADGTPYTEEAPLEIDVSKTDNVSKVVSRIYVAFAEDKSADFGKDANNNVTGAFMVEHKVSGISVSIKDFEGMPISGISDVKLSFIYGLNSQTYGGYTSSALTNALADFTIFLGNSGDGINFTQSGEQTLRYAGSYTTTFSFTLDSTTYTYSGKDLPTNTPVFTVSSVAPTVKITARTSYGSSTNTDTSATVYFNATQSSSCSSITNYSQPYVTITLSGYGNASGGSLQFTKSGGGTVHLYTSNGGTSATDKYEWTANGACQRWVGYYKSKSAQTDDKTAAGTLTADSLIMTYDGMSFTFALGDGKITINNPS